MSGRNIKRESINVHFEKWIFINNKMTTKTTEIKTINGCRYKKTTIDTGKDNTIIKSIITFSPSIPFYINFEEGKVDLEILNKNKISRYKK